MQKCSRVVGWPSGPLFLWTGTPRLTQTAAFLLGSTAFRSWGPCGCLSTLPLDSFSAAFPAFWEEGELPNPSTLSLGSSCQPCPCLGTRSRVWTGLRCSKLPHNTDATSLGAFAGLSCTIPSQSSGWPRAKPSVLCEQGVGYGLELAPLGSCLFWAELSLISCQEGRWLGSCSGCQKRR